MTYPADQSWGAVFITVGKPTQPPRPSKDFSQFTALSVEMKGASGGETLEVGLKTNQQADDGSETKLPITLTPEWQTYVFPLSRFNGAQATQLYVVAEFVFSGSKAQTVLVRKVQYGGTSEVSRSTDASGLPPVAVSHEVGRPEPKVTILYPGQLAELTSKSGVRPSLLVRGTVDDLPPGSRLYLVVHPTTDSNAYANEILLTGRKWISQAYFGEAGSLPANDTLFELFATVRDRDHPLSSMFVVNNVSLPNSSAIVAVRMKIVTWSDRASAFARDFQLSGPLAAIFTAIGTVIGILIKTKRRPKDGGAAQGGASG